MDIKELEKEFYGKFVCTDIQQPEFAVSPDRVWEWIEEKVSRVELPVKPACETKLLKTLERVIKYYSDLQTESPDNLSLGRFHLNMEILIEQFEEHLSKSV